MSDKSSSVHQSPTRILNVNEIPIKNCPVRLCCLKMLVPWTRNCTDRWSKGLHRITGWLGRVSEWGTRGELPQEPSSAALLWLWVSWGQHPRGQGQALWLRSVPKPPWGLGAQGCGSSDKGGGNHSIPEAGGQAGTPRRDARRHPHSALSHSSNSKNTTRLHPPRLLLFWIFFFFFSWTANIVPSWGDGGRAKPEDNLFLGWLSPTPWQAGCQGGNVVGRRAPVSNAAPTAAALHQALEQKRRFEPPLCWQGTLSLSRFAVMFVFHCCICLFFNWIALSPLPSHFITELYAPCVVWCFEAQVWDIDLCLSVHLVVA